MGTKDRKRDHQVMEGLRYGMVKKPPTQKHRPVLTMGILGTVYAINPAGRMQYFDYDWAGALVYAGVEAVTAQEFRELDLRVSKPKSPRYLPGHDMWHPELKIDRLAYWVRDGKERNRDE